MLLDYVQEKFKCNLLFEADVHLCYI